MNKMSLPFLVCILLLILPGYGWSQTTLTLADQLRQLAYDHDFILRGEQHTEEFPASAEEGDVSKRLRVMLENFDFVLIQPAGGNIKKLIIIGRKNALPAQAARKMASSSRSILLHTQRAGEHHLVAVSLFGIAGKVVETNLMIDTAASTVVLPTSMISKLGLTPANFSQKKFQTANGETTASMARLPKLMLGDELIANVEVAFIDDALLGGNALLGMSVLGRFRMILDDDANTLELKSK